MIGRDSLFELSMEDDVLFAKATVTAFPGNGNTNYWLKRVVELLTARGLSSHEVECVAEELDSDGTVSTILLIGYKMRVDAIVAEEVRKIFERADWPRTIVHAEVEYEN